MSRWPSFLGVSQPVVSGYERGALRLHGELIVRLAHLLRVWSDEILGIEKPSALRGPKDRAGHISSTMSMFKFTNVVPDGVRGPGDMEGSISLAHN